MAVQEQTPLQEYAANGIAKQFDLEFDCESADHLIVSIDDLEVLHTDWYLSGNAVMFHIAPANGKQVKIQRNTPFNRLADYQSYNNSFRPPAINKDFDRIWWKLQELGVADWILSNRISALKTYVDDRDDELRAYLMEEIRKQGVSLDQLDEYYNYLMERLAQIAVDKGWDASFVVDGNENQHQINNSLIRIVSNKTDLLTISNPRNKQVVYVTENEKRYTYNPNLTAPDNGVTVIGKWEMEVQDAYYASWFAEPSVTTDQSAGLRVGYVYATSKKRAFIVDDHFYVDSSINSGDPNGNPTALKTLSNSVLAFTPNGKIEHLPTNKSSYNIIHTMDVENYVILDPVLIGERDNHIGTTGEWGYLLTIYQSTNGYIRRPQCFNAWGDGIYIGKAAGTTSDDMPTNITIFEPFLKNCRRNNMSFTCGDNVKIIRPVFEDANGVAPEAGLDVEPEEVGAGIQYPSIIKNSIIESPTFINNTRNIWISWYNENRHIDLNFTGITKIIGGDFPFTFYSSSAALSDKQTGVVNFQCIDFTCTNESKKFDTELSLEDRGAVVNIEKLIIRNAERWTTHFVRFGTQDIAIAGLNIHNIQSETLNYVTFATTSVNGDKQTINPKLILGFDSSVLVTTDPDNANPIAYGDSNMGGYSVRTSVSNEYSYNYPANKIVVTPYADAYLRLNNDFRRLKIVINSVDESIHRTLYIHGVNVALLDGTVKTMVTLQGKGAWIDIRKNSSGRDTLFNLFGNAS